MHSKLLQGQSRKQLENLMSELKINRYDFENIIASAIRELSQEVKLNLKEGIIEGIDVGQIESVSHLDSDILLKLKEKAINELSVDQRKK